MKHKKDTTENTDQTFDEMVNSIVEDAKRTLVETPSDLPTRYKTAEDVFYDQLRQTQAVMTSLIESGTPKEIRAMAAVSKDLLSNYNETTRLRKLSEIECGKVVPIKVLEQYQKDIFPAIASGIDNLKMEILNTLQPNMRPMFETAWNKGYGKFVCTLKEAAGKLQEYLDEAKLEATGATPQKRKKNSETSKQKKSQAATVRHAREKNLS